MLAMNENMNLDAVSKLVDDDGVETILMNMNASINNGHIYISKNITDVTLYNENIDTAKADYTEFEDAVITKVNKK